ncbi:MAG: S4 domain-containing protein, partial [Myxococcota bacterium]
MTALHVLIVPGESAGQRLDVFLSRALNSLSRTRVQALLADGRILVDGLPGRASRRLCVGERVEVDEPPAVS